MATSSTKGRVLVIGDTQRTSRLEVLWRPQDAAQERLFDVLGREEADALFHVGDLVTWGPSRRHWRRFERLHAPLVERGVPIWPVLGNHDYLPYAGPGARAVDALCPEVAGRRWWSVTMHGVAFVGLDSNVRPLGRRRMREQCAWLDETLDALDHDPEVRAVVGLWHHPAMTNSWIVQPCPFVRREFLTRFARSRRAVAVFSGHCHAFEHFRAEGLELFVTGGGGGPLQPLRTGRWRRGEDRFRWPGRTRFTHFCAIELEEEAMRVEVVRVDERAGPDVVNEVRVPFR